MKQKLRIALAGLCACLLHATVLAAPRVAAETQAERFSEWSAILANSIGINDFKHYLAKYGISPASLLPDIQLFRTVNLDVKLDRPAAGSIEDSVLICTASSRMIERGG